MEDAEDEVGAARPDLVVAIQSGRGVGRGRQLEAEHDAGRHVVEEAGVHAHDFNIAEIFRIEGIDAGERPGVGGQAAVDIRRPHHDAPLPVEHVLEADIVPLGIEFLVQVDGGRGSGLADPILRLIAAPEFEENAAAVIPLLGSAEAADVEHAAAAGAGARRGGGEADQRHEGQHDRGDERDRRGGDPSAATAARRRRRACDGGGHGVSDPIDARRRGRLTARAQASDDGEIECGFEHDGLPALRT